MALSEPFNEADESGSRSSGRVRSRRSGALETFVAAMKAGCVYVPGVAIVFAVLVPVHTILLEQQLGARTGITALVFFIGGLAGGVTAWTVSALLARGRVWSARFSIAVIANSILVPLATAFVFFLQYRIYFAQWHAHALSETWFWQIGFTGATAVYLFIVTGVHYIFPYGIVVLIGASALFCKWSGGGKRR